ncbi:glyoxal oxidase N-terminus-domain-containing protein [Mycena rebaudengoi]|nr:glyoxal oxidase N-terminus-domain-containing protein [Mycena rebaudengoi]
MANRPTLSFALFCLLSLLASAAAFSDRNIDRSHVDPLHSFTSRNFAPRASVVLPPGWAARGCVREPTTNNRTLTGYSFTSASLTVTSCVSECNSRGFKYAGAEFQTECYCGNTFEGAAAGGGTLAPDSECNLGCGGDATQICGAGFRLSTYNFVSSTPVPPVLPAGWSFNGCVQEPSSGRTLTNYSFIDSAMTIDKCVATCHTKGFRIAGAEFANECYCGDEFQATSLGGGAAAPASDCNTKCAGEATQTCGGGNRLSTYSAQQGVPSEPTLPSGWAYVSCTQDDTNARLLSGFSYTDAALTVESCVGNCRSRGFSYAGLEFSNECYCANGYRSTPVKVAESDCNMPCAGKATETCGAGSRLSVYSSNTAATPGAPVLPPFWEKTPTCITEASTGRALTGTDLTDKSMTVDKCVSLCENTGFKYAGLEFADECYCGNSISTANGGGVVVPSTDCNMGCSGNSMQTCGAGFRLTLYTKTPPAGATLPAGWSPSMCAIDNMSRVLTGFQGTDPALTPSSCITNCAARNFSLSGVENGNECYCGNFLTNSPVGARDVQCGTPCSGDPSINCGGGFRIMIYQKDEPAPSGSNAWTLTSGGTSGVVMTHVAVVNSETLLVIDRKENNPLLNHQSLPAWGAVWSLVTNTARPLTLITHSFCSAGSFLSNGTLVNFGGHPYTDRDGQAAPDGQQGIRLFNACPASGACDIYENSKRIRLGSNRWYPSSTRLPDGSALIIGGQFYSGWTNSEVTNNPTMEYYPAKDINGFNGLPIPSPFFVETLPHNTFPHVFSLPSDKLFVAANNQAMLLDWHTNTETRLPNFPNGQRVTYPLNAAGVLLALTPENNYTAEALLCGGSQISDKIDSADLDAQHDYASAQCSRMVLNAAGIAGGWKTEWMPEPRLMTEGTLLPDGKVLILNGARTGAAGYGNLQNRLGDSNCDHPTYTPLLYDPDAPVGQRFSRAGLPTSNIARLYHSVATLLPSGAILIGGSNPNDDVSAKQWPSEYRVEYLKPPYMSKPRPTFTGIPAKIGYNAQFALTVNIPAGAQKVWAVLMDFGFITHSVHMDQKLVKLVSTLSGTQLTVQGPPSALVYSPGPGWIIVMADGIPSVAQQVMIGSGANPPENPAATANMLNMTKMPSDGPS